MVVHQVVRVPHVLGAQRVNSHNLRIAHPGQKMASTPSMQGERAGIRELLLGTPLVRRDDDELPQTAADLDEWMRALHAFLPQILGKNEAAKQSFMECERFARLPATRDGVVCKRAALLFALTREPEVARALLMQCHATEANARTTLDLQKRVLPFACPLFLRHSCQAPDAFVTLVLVLSEMWAGETLGNFAPAAASK